ncbi:MAG: thioredoxin family protein [Pirellulaceae bacterium]|nr:hypothetical protein [Planctomycetales bacterium]
MRSILGAAITVAFLLSTGCQEETRTESDTPAVESVPYVSADEFADAVAGDDAVLIEFCVPFGCFRCDEMCEQIDRLAASQQGELVVRRIDLNQQPAIARQFGVSVCPSYIAFRNGEEVFRTAYPTSSGLIVAGLDESLRNSSAE